MDAENQRLKEVVGPEGSDRADKHITLSPPEVGEHEASGKKAGRGKGSGGVPRYLSPKRNTDGDAKDVKYNENKVSARQQPTEYKQVKDPTTAAETRPTRKYVKNKGSKPIR